MSDIHYSTLIENVYPQELEAVAKFIYGEWLKFATGNKSVASYRKIVPHTLKYFKGIKMTKVGPLHFKIISDSSYSNIIEEGAAHPIYVGKKMLGGLNSRVIPLPGKYSGARKVGQKLIYTSWENRSRMKTTIPPNMAKFKATGNRFVPDASGLMKTPRRTGRSGRSDVTFVTLTKENVQDSFIIQSLHAYAPGKHLKEFADNLGPKGVAAILSIPVA